LDLFFFNFAPFQGNEHPKMNNKMGYQCGASCDITIASIIPKAHPLVAKVATLKC